MYEYRIAKLSNGEETFIFGYDLNNAYKRAKLNPAEWVAYSREYID